MVHRFLKGIKGKSGWLIHENIILQGIILALSLKGRILIKGRLEITTRHSPFFSSVYLG